jgi:hypothetical protein
MLFSCVWTSNDLPLIVAAVVCCTPSVDVASSDTLVVVALYRDTSTKLSTQQMNSLRISLLQIACNSSAKR